MPFCPHAMQIREDMVSGGLSCSPNSAYYSLGEAGTFLSGGGGQGGEDGDDYEDNSNSNNNAYSPYCLGLLYSQKR